MQKVIDKTTVLVYNIIVTLSERICRRIEVVITGLTRNLLRQTEAETPKTL